MPSLRLGLCSIGFIATVAQIVLMRELLVASAGNELSLGLTLALWLFWTAVGSALFGKLAARRSPRMIFAALLALIAAMLFVSLVLVRTSRSWWHAAPGELLGPTPIFITAALTLAAFCLVSGWLFAAGAQAWSHATASAIAEGGSRTYLLETVGATIGGVLASVLFLPHFSSFQVAVVVAATALIIAVWIATSSRPARTALSIVVVLSAVAALPVVRRAEVSLLSRDWPGFKVLPSRNSRYGSLAVLETEGGRSVTQSGITLFTAPDPPAAEEAVHFALLEHRHPQSVLLIGGGLNGSISQILQYQSVERLDYVELDPALLQLGRDFFRDEWTRITSDKRVHVHEIDGRLFVKSTQARYDVVILNLPEPQTAQLNRFYTEEFYGEVKQRLNPEGIFAFQIHASEEYISPDLAALLRCLHRTISREFPDVVAVPGETIHILASADPNILTTDSRTLLTRITERGIHTDYVSSYYLPFRMSPARVERLQQVLQPTPETRINRDFAPIAYYFDIMFWGMQYSPALSDLLKRATTLSLVTIAAFVALVTIAMIFLARVNTRSLTHAAEYSVAAAGFALMGTQILLLLGFQAIYGYVFNQLAIIIAGFMAGLALGSWKAIRTHGSDANKNVVRLLSIQIAIVLLPALIVAALMLLAPVSSSQRNLLPALSPVLALICGAIGGYEFPVAMEVMTSTSEERSAAGRLYGFDLLGGCLGAVCVSVFLLPIFGFAKVALVLAIVSVGPVVLLATLSGPKTQPR